jgi:hypothetical protein
VSECLIIQIPAPAARHSSDPGPVQRSQRDHRPPQKLVLNTFDNAGGKVIEQLINIVEHDDDIEILLDAEEIHSLVVALLIS